MTIAFQMCREFLVLESIFFRTWNASIVNIVIYFSFSKAYLQRFRDLWKQINKFCITQSWYLIFKHPLIVQLTDVRVQHDNFQRLKNLQMKWFCSPEWTMIHMSGTDANEVCFCCVNWKTHNWRWRIASVNPNLWGWRYYRSEQLYIGEYLRLHVFEKSLKE